MKYLVQQSANNPALIAIQNLKDTNNIIFTNDASRKTRPGYDRFDVSGQTETQNMKYLFDFWRRNGATGSQSNKVVALVNGKLMADNQGDGAFSDITGAFVIPQTDNVTMDVFSGLLLMAFENIAPKQYNHTGDITNLAGSPPSGSLIRVHRGYAWMAGISSTPHRLHRSQADNPLIWTGATTETIDIDDGDGDPDGITALFPSFYGDLYVAKRKSLYRVRLDSSGVFGVELVLRGVGCISHNSVVALQNDIIFCSERGVHSLAATQKYGDADTAFLSAPIHDIYNDGLEFTRAKEIMSTYVPSLNSYIMSFPKKGSPKSRDLLGYNIVTGQWYRWKGTTIPVVTTFIDSRKRTRLMVGLNSGKIALANEEKNFDFDTDVINTTFSTGIIYPLGDPNREVSYKSLTVITRPQGKSTFTVTTKVDGDDVDTLVYDQSGKSVGTPLGTFILGSSKLGNLGEVKVESLPLSGVGRGIELTFTRNPDSATISQGLEVLGYIIEVIDSHETDISSVQ